MELFDFEVLNVYSLKNYTGDVIHMICCVDILYKCSDLSHPTVFVASIWEVSLLNSPKNPSQTIQKPSKIDPQKTINKNLLIRS